MVRRSGRYWRLQPRKDHRGIDILCKTCFGSGFISVQMKIMASMESEVGVGGSSGLVLADLLLYRFSIYGIYLRAN